MPPTRRQCGSSSDPRAKPVMSASLAKRQIACLPAAAVWGKQVP